LFNFSELEDDDKDELLKQMQEDIIKGDFNITTIENRSGNIIDNYIQWRVSESNGFTTKDEYTTQATIHMGADGTAKKEMG
jgi:hypothetical protein